MPAPCLPLADGPELAGRRALVTGAASGIGFEAAETSTNIGDGVGYGNRNRVCACAGVELVTLGETNGLLLEDFLFGQLGNDGRGLSGVRISHEGWRFLISGGT